MRYRASILGYQVRYGDGAEPETLLASDVADAMQQTRQRADRTGATVALWRNGALIAECEPSNPADRLAAEKDLVAELIRAGVYVFPPPKT